MKINPNIFRGYDLRGIVNKDLNPEIVELIGRVYGTLMKQRGINKAIVGRDCRATSFEYSEALIKGFCWAGLDVIDIGMTLVGIFYWGQFYLNCKGGAFVTASHNSAEYNGFKFAIDFSETLVGDGIQELREKVEKEDCKKAEILGKIEKQNIQEPYFNDLIKRLPITKKFKVVIDPSCSTAGVIAPDLLRRVGCEVIENNCKIDSSFPLGVPDPTELKVAERLREKVIEVNADIGFSYDADGDRIGIVDNKGNIIWNDVLIALFATDILSYYPGAKIMYNTLCSKVVKETILQRNGIPFMWRTGHSFLKKKNQEIKAPFVGELSGHFFFSADFYNHDDGLYSTLRLLSYLSKTNQTLSDAITVLPKFISSPEVKVGCPDNLKVDLINRIAKRLKQEFQKAEIIDDERAGDGIYFDTGDTMFVIRYSQNGPYLTVKFEAKIQEKYDKLKKYINNLLHNYNEIDWKAGSNVEVLID
ncbi:hypothetical protein CVV26_02055 [Candidatus Kuenenbacteria bacterium HGW-Kuenenbacteria-1]|uniref:Phosphomannomutase n=1 Tax=Candidatus Kuenenbacteria bacterium HGW-Kuenenbacteria-1 TaxID=2013812 RepID=A0A2N1UND9_9BACT|nr:MAG: hypothetical protein CVV26_02055 [Candidatus Kuenenbacteria bacterium HGW-Kuenenbacteria-1]